MKTNFMSGMLNDRTQGQDQIPEALVYILKMFITYPKDWATLWMTYEEKWIFTPMWVPQLSMSIGTILLAICLWDHLYRMAVTGVNPIKQEVLK